MRAFRADGTASDPVSITVTILPKGVTPVPTVQPTATVGPGTPSPMPPGCLNNSFKIADITIPDGESHKPNEGFTKVWRVLNNGTCPWNGNFKLASVGGEAMTATPKVAVPYTPVGAMVDLSVTMVAPTAPGPHAGHWRLLDDNGNPFGIFLDVVINVPNPQPPPACTGAPGISSFTASATQVPPHTAVTLNWGLVSNANYAKIDPGIGPVATPGSITIVVDGTTTFVLTAYCGSNVATAQLAVNVVSPAPTPTPVPPTPKPAFRVTGASMNVSPSNYVGHCPGHFYYTGSITTNDVGAVTYRWVGSGSVSPSPIMTFYAPGPGTHALPGYSQEWGSKGSLWVQLAIVTPNQLNSNQASFTNSCSDPTPIPPPTHTPVPPPTHTPVPPPPTHTPVPPPTHTPVPPRPNINGTWRAPNHFLIENLQEAFGCMNYPCAVAGKFMDIRGTPLDGELNGTFDGRNLTFNVVWNLPGAQALSFNGTLSGNVISGNWRMGGETGQVTFVR